MRMDARPRRSGRSGEDSTLLRGASRYVPKVAEREVGSFCTKKDAEQAQAAYVKAASPSPAQPARNRPRAV